MSELYVTRRANGDFFTLQSGDKLRVPVWSGVDAVEKYKAHNPELAVYLPARLDRRVMAKIKSSVGKDDSFEFFLLSDDAPGADLDEGEPLAEGEIFPASQGVPGKALSQRVG